MLDWTRYKSGQQTISFRGRRKCGRQTETSYGSIQSILVGEGMLEGDEQRPFKRTPLGCGAADFCAGLDAQTTPFK